MWLSEWCTCKWLHLHQTCWLEKLHILPKTPQKVSKKCVLMNFHSSHLNKCIPDANQLWAMAFPFCISCESSFIAVYCRWFAYMHHCALTHSYPLLPSRNHIMCAASSPMMLNPLCCSSTSAAAIRWSTLVCWRTSECVELDLPTDRRILASYRGTHQHNNRFKHHVVSLFQWIMFLILLNVLISPYLFNVKDKTLLMVNVLPSFLIFIRGRFKKVETKSLELLFKCWCFLWINSRRHCEFTYKRDLEN